MLSKHNVAASIPASDLARAKQWYADKLGLMPVREDPGGLTYTSGSSTFTLYPSQGAGMATHTLMAWSVENVEAEVADLRGRGVVIEEYDFPGLKTVDGIATLGPNKAAWFKDSEGNILGLFQ